MVIDAPTLAKSGLILAILGGGMVNVTPLLATWPAAVTSTLPVVAPVGTVAVILVLLHEPIVAVVPLNVTPPLPCVAPKFDPAITTDEPTTPVLGVRLLILGAAVTVKLTPLLATPPAAVTTTFPVAAFVGAVAVMLLALQLVTVAVSPLVNVTMPLPCEGPKFEPAMTTEEPTAPIFGVRLLILGAPVTVKVTPLLATLLIVTTTLPVVAPLGTVAVMLVELKLVIVAWVPLNFTVALDWLFPKPLPAMTMEEPTAPVFGVRVVMLGAAKAATATNRDNPRIARRIFFIHSSQGCR